MIDRLKAELGDGDRFVVETLRPLPVQVNDFLVGSHPDGRLLIAEWSGDSVSTAGDETLPSQATRLVFGGDVSTGGVYWASGWPPLLALVIC